ncbi:hypothetical protein H2248_008356 [Termitomyces sp. 'cryptogamus']|nr:hypothetical protein H2248_008356 [Termitomyces sp. 'cryptogamus']
MIASKKFVASSAHQNNMRLKWAGRSICSIIARLATMLVFLAQFVALLVLVWTFKRFLSKRDIDNIPGPKPESFIKGNMGQIFSASNVGWKIHSMISEQYGRVARLWGPFGLKYLETYDPKAMHHIFVKDQVIYEETSSFFARNIVAFGQGISTTQGEPHKKQRKMLNPVFSITYMRNMIPIFSDIAKKIEKAITIKLAQAQGAQEVDVLHWMSRAALEMIGQSGFGYSFDPLVEGTKPHPFCDAAKAFSPNSANLALEIEYLLPTIVKIGSPRFRRWLVDHFPSRRLRAYRDMVDTWHWTMTQIFEEKKRALMGGDEALANQVEQAKDLLSILIKANIAASEEDRVSDEEVLGQMSSFIFAATDTTSNALSRTLHLLASQPEIQERLRAEVTEAREAHGGDIPYDDLVSLPFMDAVCRETLRLHPPVPMVPRISRQDIILPLLTTIKGIDGREMESILVPKDTKIFISIQNANRDPLLWGPDSLEWIPERWLRPLPQALHEAHMPGIYSHLLTFLGGGRACMGFKFSQLEMKVVLSTLISQFHFYPPRKEIVWQMGVITTPTVKDSPETPQLPLIVELVKA